MKRIWVMKDGTEINIKDMSDSHLINAIKMIRRMAQVYLNSIIECPPMFQGEMAQYCAERDWDIYCEMDVDQFAEENDKRFEGLVHEATKRKLEF